MTEYLSYKFEDTSEFISTFDELPLWSASFGLFLLKHLNYKRDLTILDIGSGAGFPLLELAGRFGSSCKCYGLDIWQNANARARQKVLNYNVDNVEVIEGSAEQIPLGDSTVDLIVSNLGINNFSNPPVVFKECRRILKPDGNLAITTNLNGHWKEFYTVFEATLIQLGKNELVGKLLEHQRHRGTVDSISGMFVENGFVVSKHATESFEMKFADGSAFLNHYFVKLGWLASWKDLMANEDLAEIFGTIEQNLNSLAAFSEGLTLTVPMAYIEGTKSGS